MEGGEIDAGTVFERVEESGDDGGADPAPRLIDLLHGSGGYSQMISMDDGHVAVEATGRRPRSELEKMRLGRTRSSRLFFLEV